MCARAIAASAGEILGAPVGVRVLPPVSVEAVEWARLCDGRRIYELHGESADATFLLDEASAQAIVALAFGESASAEPLSAIETRVLDRCMARFAEGMHAVCGAVKVSQASTTYSTRQIYCELRFSEPLGGSLGIALCEEACKMGPRLRADVLEGCPIECRVQLGAANVDIFTVASLAVGDIVRLETKVGGSATLKLGPDPIAAGEGGVLGDRTAFKVHQLI